MHAPRHADENLTNEDLAQIPMVQRTWSMWSYTALWTSRAACIPTYMLNAHAGAKYGIPFPVYCRASFGTLGANVPDLLRALVACGLILLCWAYSKAGGLGPMLAAPSAFDPGQPQEGEFLSVFFPTLTAIMAVSVTLASAHSSWPPCQVSPVSSSRPVSSPIPIRCSRRSIKKSGSSASAWRSYFISFFANSHLPS